MRDDFVYFLVICLNSLFRIVCLIIFWLKSLAPLVMLFRPRESLWFFSFLFEFIRTVNLHYNGHFLQTSQNCFVYGFMRSRHIRDILILLRRL